jgi:hypothetical protein
LIICLSKDRFSARFFSAEFRLVIHMWVDVTPFALKFSAYGDGTISS